MPITKLHFTNVGPFDDIEFEFDRQVNVFTGPNNSGKSTILWVLGEALVYPFSFPDKLLKPGSNEFQVRTRTNGYTQAYTGTIPLRKAFESSLRSRRQTGTQSGVADENERLRTERIRFLSSLGYSCFIPALRRSTDFRVEGPLIERTTRENRNQQTGEPPVDDYLSGINSNPFHAYVLPEDVLHIEYAIDPEVWKRRALLSTNASLVSDEAVIQKIVDLDYQSYRRQQPAARDIVQTVGTVASEITEGFPIEFKGVGEDQRGLFPQFGTLDGDVPLDVLSQGTQSMIQWLAQLLIGYAEFYDYPVDLAERPGILIIDEIDAHLHPSWQRRIIPTLIKHLPNLQIFCSTHSPLMLAGLKEGQVQLLKRDANSKVVVSKNETDIIGWSADEILRNFLDVRSPTDIETVKHLERLQALRQKDVLSEEEAEELEQLRHQVNQDLLGGSMAAELDRLTDLLKEAKAHVDGPPARSSSAESRPDRRRRNRSK
jgi:predicted ATP-binding protein involved in virulence